MTMHLETLSVRPPYSALSISSLSRSEPQRVAAPAIASQTHRDPTSSKKEFPGLCSADPFYVQALEAWVDVGRKGIVCLPPHLKKSEWAALAIASQKASTLVLVAGRGTQKQWQSALAKSLEQAIGCVHDTICDIRTITVATWSAALRHRAELQAQFECVLLDETQALADPQNEVLLDILGAHARAGLTTTPSEYLYRRESAERILGGVIFETSLRTFKPGQASPYRHCVIFVPLTEAERFSYFEHMRHFNLVARAFVPNWPAAPIQKIIKHLSQTKEGSEALESRRLAMALVAASQNKLDAIGRILERCAGKRCLVFTATAQAAYDISKTFFIPAVTSLISRNERELYLRGFAEGTLPALVSCRVLNDTSDLPPADVVIIAGGAFGQRELTARIGRVLNSDPTHHPEVYELAAEQTFEETKAKRQSLSLVAKEVLPYDAL